MLLLSCSLTACYSFYASLYEVVFRSWYSVRMPLGMDAVCLYAGGGLRVPRGYPVHRCHAELLFLPGHGGLLQWPRAHPRTSTVGDLVVLHSGRKRFVPAVRNFINAIGYLDSLNV